MPALPAQPAQEASAVRRTSSRDTMTPFSRNRKPSFGAIIQRRFESVRLHDRIGQEGARGTTDPERDHRTAISAIW